MTDEELIAKAREYVAATVSDQPESPARVIIMGLIARLEAANIDAAHLAQWLKQLGEVEDWTDRPRALVDYALICHNSRVKAE